MITVKNSIWPLWIWKLARKIKQTVRRWTCSHAFLAFIARRGVMNGEPVGELVGKPWCRQCGKELKKLPFPVPVPPEVIEE